MLLKKTILLLLVLAAITTFGGAFLRNASRHVVNPTSGCHSTPTFTGAPSIAPQKGWRLYRNSEFEFQLYYPPGLDVEEEPLKNSDQSWVTATVVQFSPPESSESSPTLNVSVQRVRLGDQPKKTDASVRELSINGIPVEEQYVLTEMGTSRSYIFSPADRTLAFDLALEDSEDTAWAATFETMVHSFGIATSCN